MKHLKYFFTFLFLALILVSFPTSLWAQSDPGCDPVCNCRSDGSICPIDNGLYLLLGIGVLYGIFKYWKQIKPVKLDS